MQAEVRVRGDAAVLWARHKNLPPVCLSPLPSHKMMTSAKMEFRKREEGEGEREETDLSCLSTKHKVVEEGSHAKSYTQVVAGI